MRNVSGGESENTKRRNFHNTCIYHDLFSLWLKIEFIFTGYSKCGFSCVNYIFKQRLNTNQIMENAQHEAHINS